MTETYKIRDDSCRAFCEDNAFMAFGVSRHLYSDVRQ